MKTRNYLQTHPVTNLSLISRVSWNRDRVPLPNWYSHSISIQL